ncbi:HAMP domain-containing sensor histidine kinase [uncultured Thiodictyon sp.]|uniref:sensor histidine kinase n=1 Tax=uncultured Thiodictyon sp. TaxID=1846217 RepID=UPI0025D33208|nr:HAMP domain-containing sensor histidine kinase [uncultured Thiodictyon sp.]
MSRDDTDRARTRLRVWLGGFFVALALPSAALVDRAYDQLKWESFRVQQVAAEDLAARVDQRLSELVRVEDARPVADYAFLVADPASPQGRRSPLAALPVTAGPPGLVGWFQVAEDGRFSSPFLPEGSAVVGLAPAELAERQALAARIEGVLIGNRLVERGRGGDEPPGRSLADTAEPLPAPATNRVAEQAQGALDRGAAGAATKAMAAAPAKAQAPRERLSQQAFERLGTQRQAASAAAESDAEYTQHAPNAPVQGLGRVDELTLDSALAKRAAPAKAAPPAPAAALRAEPPAPAKTAPTPVAGVSRSKDERARAPLGLFANAVQPCELGLLGSGHFVLFRAVRQGGGRIIQGLLIEQGPFLAAVLAEPFRATSLARTTDLIVAFRDAVLTAFRAAQGREYVSSARELTGALLYRTRMREPFGGLELIFSVGRLPVPAGALVIGWVGGLLALVLVIGTWFMYRLGLKQIALVRQQQAFVSAVSHELKTPLTSIRLYAEMLRAGFAEEDRRQVYYRYIQEESERLSRLIANVLALSRIGRDALTVSPQELDLTQLMTLVQERVASQVERAGFRLVVACAAGGTVRADPDAFVQVLINLVDNALKFAAQGTEKTVEIRCEQPRAGWVRIAVRDFGPGVPRELRRRVFQLFYRGADAGARAIPGTGIGLALVERLTLAMGGRVDVVNREPGAEFRVELPDE